MTEEEKDALVMQAVMNTKGREKLAAAMVQPIRDQLDYIDMCPGCRTYMTNLYGHRANGCVYADIYNTMEM